MTKEEGKETNNSPCSMFSSAMNPAPFSYVFPQKKSAGIGEDKKKKATKQHQSLIVTNEWQMSDRWATLNDNDESNTRKLPAQVLAYRWSLLPLVVSIQTYCHILIDISTYFRKKRHLRHEGSKQQWNKEARCALPSSWLENGDKWSWFIWDSVNVNIIVTANRDK